MDNPSSTDQFNKLPNDILRELIALLPPLDAVRTSILSKRWVHVWTSAPFQEIKLCDLDDGDFQLHENFDIFVENFLSLANLNNMKSFSLHCIYPYGVERWQQWLDAACTAGKVEEVDIDLTLEVYYPLSLPEVLRWSTSLRMLKIRANFDLHPAADEVCFPHLKVLHVYVSDARNNLFTQRLYNYFPVLEDLTIEGSMNEDIPYVKFEIASATLRKLKVIYDMLGFYDHDDDIDDIECTFLIRAPNLEHVELSDDFLANYIFDNSEAMLIDSAQISIGNFSVRPMRSRIIWSLQFEEENPFKFLKGLSSVKTLTLSGSTVGALRNYIRLAGVGVGVDAVVADTLPVMGSLTTLKLGFLDCCSWDLLSYVLPYMPRVKHLALEKEEVEFRECTKPWKKPTGVPYCLLQHLKTVEIERFTGKVYEKAVIQYLLENGEELESMTIHYGSAAEAEQVMNRNTILTFAKASEECQIFFV